MQIFIDGYNLLFRLQSYFSDIDFSQARMHLIEELERHAKEFKLSMTCVFDAPFQDDDLCQSHFYSLKIVFTPKGMTADDYLLDCFRHAKNPRLIKLVTSDRGLLRKAKAMGVETEKAEEFLIRLRKKVKKKQKVFRQDLPILKEEKTVNKKLIKVFEEKEKVQKRGQKKSVLPSLADIDAWIKIFSEQREDVS